VSAAPSRESSCQSPMTPIKIDSVTGSRPPPSTAHDGRADRRHAVEEERRARLRRLREQIAANPPDHSYFDKLEEWQSDRW